MLVLHHHSFIIILLCIHFQFVYWSVRGLHIHNQFSVIIWDMIFQEDSYTVYVLEGVSGLAVFNLNDALKMTNVTYVVCL